MFERCLSLDRWREWSSIASEPSRQRADDDVSESDAARVLKQVE